MKLYLFCKTNDKNLPKKEVNFDFVSHAHLVLALYFYYILKIYIKKCLNVKLYIFCTPYDKNLPKKEVNCDFVSHAYLVLASHNKKSITSCVSIIEPIKKVEL